VALAGLVTVDICERCCLVWWTSTMFQGGIGAGHRVPVCGIVGGMPCRGEVRFGRGSCAGCCSQAWFDLGLDRARLRRPGPGGWYCVAPGGSVLLVSHGRVSYGLCHPAKSSRTR
jgi:hypothetical protein